MSSVAIAAVRFLVANKAFGIESINEHSAFIRQTNQIAYDQKVLQETVEKGCEFNVFYAKMTSIRSAIEAWKQRAVANLAAIRQVDREGVTLDRFFPSYIPAAVNNRYTAFMAEVESTDAFFRQKGTGASSSSVVAMGAPAVIEDAPSSLASQYSLNENDDEQRDEEKQEDEEEEDQEDDFVEVKEPSSKKQKVQHDSEDDGGMRHAAALQALSDAKRAADPKKVAKQARVEKRSFKDDEQCAMSINDQSIRRILRVAGVFGSSKMGKKRIAEVIVATCKAYMTMASALSIHRRLGHKQQNATHLIKQKDIVVCALRNGEDASVLCK